MPVPAAGVGGDPAISVDLRNGGYIQNTYVRGADGIMYEAESLGPFVGPATPMINNNNSGFSGAPSAAGNLDGWEGNHVVVGRKNGQFHTASPCPNIFELC